MIRAFLFVVFTCAVSTFGQAQPTMTIKVFFHNEKFNPNQIDCTKVFPTTRTITKTRSMARAALDELFKGVTPEEEKNEFGSFPPEKTMDILKGLSVKGGVAYVNFDKSVYEKLGNTTSSCGSGFYSTIDATLKQFPTVKKVVYAIEGSTADFYDWQQVGECPYSKKTCSRSKLPVTESLRIHERRGAFRKGLHSVFLSRIIAPNRTGIQNILTRRSLRVC